LEGANVAAFMEDMMADALFVVTAAGVAVGWGISRQGRLEDIRSVVWH
jgi:hypothetical protein